MERRKSKRKSMKRLSSVKSRSKTLGHSVLDKPELPTPNFEIEDVLLSQLQVSDVLSNCVLRENTSSWSLNEGNNYPPIQKGKTNSLYHRCYSDSTLNPLWLTFAAQGTRSNGQVLLGRLMSLSASLSTLLGEEHHSSLAIQQQFIEYSHVPFSKYRRYVLDTTSHKVINSEELCAICWGHCKPKYLNNPLVDHLDSVVPPELCDALYYLFCIFNKLTEPGTYPPTMDYEETELFLRKLLACLDMPWISTPEDSLFNEDFDKQGDFEPSPPLQQLLSIIADMVGVEMANSNLFYKAVRRLCLMEYQEVVRAGWVMVRKAGSDAWKKRWGVLQSSKLTCYDTMLCQVVKEEIYLHSNMHVESLPNISSHKHRFRIVEKEGFTIICEHELSCPDSSSSHSWISLVNVTIKIHKADMSAKTAEICERRLERFSRRESVREVYKKKQDVLETHQRLQEAKKRRSTIEEKLQQRAKQREEQMVFMTKMDKIYERLESIQFQRRLHNKEEREKRLMKLFTNHEESIKLGRIIEDSWLSEKDNSKSLQELSVEEAQLERELEILQETPILLTLPTPSIQPNDVDNPSITLRLPPESVNHSHESSYSFSESTSMTSNDATMLTLPDVTLHT